MGLGDWIKGLFRPGGSDDVAAKIEEYDLPDPGAEDLHEHPAPSLFGGVEPPDEHELKPPADLAP